MDSKYYFDKRTKDWIKFKRMADEEFVICGYIQKDNGMNTLVLGQYSKERLIYRGHVTLGVKLDFLQDHKCNRMDFSPFTLTPSGNEGVVWLEPSLVGVVEYMPNTKDSLRQAVFKGVRDDIEAKECKIK
ncbi:ATP dependent DNA ligase [Anaerotignum sp.]|uniref:ATP dependent DNA ligase n=1 Tax=Anaerotignum sp. TaxID=2039241 RepID=UPI0027145490|nr:hypothetical protein [Anaerotignum sp.]